MYVYSTLHIIHVPVVAMIINLCLYESICVYRIVLLRVCISDMFAGEINSGLLWNSVEVDHYKISTMV